MRMRVLIAALAVSLLFNAAVLIGFVQKRATSRAERSAEQAAATRPDDQAQGRRLARELGLDQAQSAAFEGLQKRQKQLSSLFADSVAVIRQDLTAELAKEEPDLDRVRSLVDQEAELMRQRRRAGAALYGEFMDVLTPSQKQRLGERLAAPPPQPPQQQQQRGQAPPDVVRRFDRNGNGRLDPDEAQAARRDLESRRREMAPHVPQRPPLWPWFDADDDGKLNEAERAKMAAFMRENNISPEEIQPQPGMQGRPGRRGGDGGGQDGPLGRPGGARGDRPPSQPPVQQGPPNEPPPPPSDGAPNGGDAPHDLAVSA